MERRISPRQLEQRLRAAQRDYERIKQRILDVGFVCEGSLVERWMPCGKANCRCVDPAQRHGPYWQLSWKEGGKTVSRRLSPEHAVLYREWIANRRQLDALVRQLHEVSATARQHLLGVADDAAAPPARRPPPRR
ncbi:MAG: hypothetical protein M3276_00570 [Actinomycetota bacterium]|nr:hypothetical protein [Actinomycetota bacterium]